MARYVAVDVEECAKTTDGAALLVVDGGEFWVPWSQFEADSGDIDGEGDSGVAYISRWFCEKEDIPYEEA